jgi:hypothetical protein
MTCYAKSAPVASADLVARLATEGRRLHEKYGPEIGWSQLNAILADRSVVRFPCELVFDAAPLLPGEFAHAVRKGTQPDDGFLLHVHPSYASQPSRIPYLVLSQLPYVNHGNALSAEDAEVFGGHALGISKEAYYQELCGLAEDLCGDELC